MPFIWEIEEILILHRVFQSLIRSLNNIHCPILDLANAQIKEHIKDVHSCENFIKRNIWRKKFKSIKNIFHFILISITSLNNKGNRLYGNNAINILQITITKNILHIIKLPSTQTKLQRIL